MPMTHNKSLKTVDALKRAPQLNRQACMRMENRNLEEVEKTLVKVFPSYASQLEKDKQDDEWGYSLHSLFRDFLHFFSKNEGSFTEKQLKNFAEFVNESVVEKDDLENAISTCFLEHLSQVNAAKAVKPLLSSQAKECMHA